ncbi:MAG: tetratricopeptide repeat protein [Alphaproteobacteria bacterium]|nr:tetratricopeptide repeat protein [Alphaproteobacteria bacterium]
MARTALIVVALAWGLALPFVAPMNALAGPAGEDDARYGMEASKQGKLREALGYFKRAIQAKGLKGHQLSAVYVNRGLTYYRMAKYSKAIADFNTALKIVPKNAYAYNNRGLAHEKMGNRALAIRDYRAALKIDPTLWRTKTNLERLGARP